ncbi:hypothetical protein EsDP_00004068 [Epichloe bromicola]|uniref:Uncharacterized protein n=1 Tax=Epichloe bromicola TaxID=79588 RepID=A0ABQ0CQM9_9HYPO
MSRRPVHVVIHRDDTTVTVAGVFASLSDANAECLRLCEEAGLQLKGVKKGVEDGKSEGDMNPMKDEPLRWDSPEGLSCWVETHGVI